MAFDTQRAARRLADAGLDERAAAGVADVVDSATSGLATERSLLELRGELLSFRAELKEDLLSFRAELKEDLLASRAEFKEGLLASRAELKEDLLSFRAEFREGLLASRAELKEDVHSLRAEMYRTLWLQGAGIVAATAAIVGIATALD